jgi:cytidylate kinase
VPPADAEVVDTTRLTVDEVVDRVVSTIAAKTASRR